MVNGSLLKSIRFMDLNKWSANYSLFEKIKSEYPLVPLFKVLRRAKEPVTIDDKTLYKRVKIRLYGQGVLKRDELYGVEIGTKKQFIAHEGQLVISRIDARNGAFGIVPPELDGAIVTNDFWLFDVNNALPQYLTLVLSSKRFQKYWMAQSSGTTNRQRVGEEDFLQAQIALPSIEIQNELLNQYNDCLQQSEKDKKEIVELQAQIERYLINELGVLFKESSFNGLLGTADYKNLSRWDPLYLSSKVTIVSCEKIVDIAEVVTHFMSDPYGKNLRVNTKAWPDEEFVYIGMEHVEKNTGNAFPQKVLGKDLLSQTVHVPANYVIYGKLRPYLNKYWENIENIRNIVCSAEFFVFDTKDINRSYFMEVLSSAIIQEQLPSLYSGARMPRINEDDFLGLKIPLPPESRQQQIVSHISEMRKRIMTLQYQIPLYEQRAKKEFEEAVFGETQEIKNTKI